MMSTVDQKMNETREMNDETIFCYNVTLPERALHDKKSVCIFSSSQLATVEECEAQIVAEFRGFSSAECSNPFAAYNVYYYYIFENR